MKRILNAAVVSWILIGVLVWITRDGLGPDSLESSGWSALVRFFWSFYWGPILIVLAVAALVLRRRSGRSLAERQIVERRRSWPRITLLAVTLTAMGVLSLLSLDLMGIGPNLGLPFGYYGRFNRIVARIQASPDVEVVRTTLHRDQDLEDFYITVRTQDGRAMRLRFEESHTQPFSELLRELERVGI